MVQPCCKRRYLANPMLWLIIGIGSAASIGCGGNDKAIGTELTNLGATVLNYPGKDGIPSTVMLADMKGKEVDLDQAIPLVAQLGQLKSLILTGTGATDDHLSQVRKLSTLVDLQLTDTAITDAGVAHLTGLSKLSSLNLSGTKVTSSCLADVSKLSKLTGLYIDNTAVSGGYEALQALPELVLLVAGNLPITEKDAQEIAGIPKLSTLYVNGSKLEGGSKEILDAGIDTVNLAPDGGAPQE